MVDGHQFSVDSEFMSSYYFENSTVVMKVLIILSLIIAVSSMAFAGSDDLKSKIAAGGNKLIVLDFYATWCGTCGMIGPKFDELAALHRDVTFLKVDCDKNESIADQYKITNLPTFIFIKNNKELTRFNGANYEQLKSTILRYK